MANRIEFSDGRYFYGTCGPSDNILVIKTDQATIAKYFNDFMNPKKTKVITEYADVIKFVYEGYTVFNTISLNREGTYSVFLSSPGTYSNRKIFRVPRELVPKDMLDMAEFED